MFGDNKSVSLQGDNISKLNSASCSHLSIFKQKLCTTMHLKCEKFRFVGLSL